jgi:Cytochrome P460
VDVPDVFTQAFVMEMDSKRFPKSGGWGCALFNYQAASDKFTADPSPADCGNTCHTAVKRKDYIFHPYQKRSTAPARDIKHAAELGACVRVALTIATIVASRVSDQRITRPAIRASTAFSCL